MREEESESKAQRERKRERETLFAMFVRVYICYFSYEGRDLNNRRHHRVLQQRPLPAFFNSILRNQQASSDPTSTLLEGGKLGASAIKPSHTLQLKTKITK